MNSKTDSPLAETNHLEIEVKFYIDDMDSIRKRILDHGAIGQGRIFEQNIRFEDSQNSLIQKQSLLRLRHDTTARLTFKSTPPVTDSRFKIFRELEVEVSDFSIMKQILESLGFHAAQIYEKWRETFTIGKTHLCLDTLPFGDFLEIEGTKESILSLASSLELRWEDRILKNYLELFSMLKNHFHLLFRDVTFENFNNLRLDLPSCRHLLIS